MPLVLRASSSAWSGQEAQSQRTSEELGNRLTFKMEFAPTAVREPLVSPCDGDPHHVLAALLCEAKSVGQAETLQVWSPGARPRASLWSLDFCHLGETLASLGALG